MRKYELTIIFRVEEDNFSKGKEIVKKELDHSKFNILKEDDLGVKDLAYPIKKEIKGHYYFFEIEADPEKIIEFDKSIKLTHELLKFLIIKKDK